MPGDPCHASVLASLDDGVVASSGLSSREHILCGGDSQRICLSSVYVEPFHCTFGAIGDVPYRVGQSVAAVMPGTPLMII